MQQMSRTKQFFYLVFGGGLSQLSTFLITIILARKLSSVDYGTYRQVLLVSTLIIPIFSSAIPNSLLYFIPRLKTKEEKIALVRRTIKILFCLGFLTSITMIVFSVPAANQFNNPSLQKYLILGSLYPALILGASYLTPFMIAIGQARLSAIYASLTSFINLIFVSIMVIFIGSLSSVVIAIILSSCFSLVFALYLSNKHLRIFSQTGKKSVPLKKQISYAVPLGLATIVSVWGLKIDQAIVSSYFDVSTFAIYSIGAMEFPLVGLISSSIYSVLFPEISRLMGEGKKDEALKLWQRTIEKSMLVIMPIFGAAMIASYPLITMLYTKKYEASVPIFQIYLFLIPIRAINFGLLLRAIGKTKYDFYGSILFMLVNLIFAISTVKFLGVFGPTLSMVFSVYVLSTYLLFNIKKENAFKFSEILNFKALLPIILITISPVMLLGILRSSFTFNSNFKSATVLFIYLIIIILLYKSTGKWSKLLLRKA